MNAIFQTETHIVRLLSLANQSSANLTVQCSLIEASVLIEQLDTTDGGVAHFAETAFNIHMALLKGLDNMVSTDYAAITDQIAELRNFLETQQHDLTQRTFA